MAWTEVFAVLVLSHLVGDYALQTDWQARHKRGGLTSGSAVARRALLAHIATYAVAFVPALVWLAGDLGGGVLVLEILIVVPHLIQDDGLLLHAYARKVKRVDLSGNELLAVSLDQVFHLVALFGAALIAAG